MAIPFRQRNLSWATMLSPYVFPLLLAGLAWHTAQAAPLYKWRGSTGQVTYSSLPPPAGIKAEQLQVLPHPTAEEIRQAEARVKKMEEQASEMEARRLKQAADEARLRALKPTALPPVVIEKPVYVPEPIYYPPVRVSPRRHPDKKPRERHPDKTPHDRPR